MALPGGSNFHYMQPNVGVKIKEGKMVKESEEMFGEAVGKTSKAKYLEMQEK